MPILPGAWGGRPVLSNTLSAVTAGWCRMALSSSHVFAARGISQGSLVFKPIQPPPFTAAVAARLSRNTCVPGSL
ncbi:hypothetical protein E2C01_020396 [Portunus trituberculatus]|uniref:Uncharacterized protein n=1 Tax=Portunus trituberculatus TaxID=210409 RepID=A0A5B7E004_PORTR|nr:hypothetical protein [Portunus trituberculatus]